MTRTSLDSGILVVELDAPPDNALTTALLEGLTALVSEASRNPEVRGLVLASAFPKVFSAGLSVPELAPGAGLGTRPFRSLIDAHKALAGFPKPSVAAVGGLAVLGGWILALGCDLRVFSDDAKCTLSEVRLGLSPTEALVRTSLSLARDPGAVRRMVLKGTPLKAEEALAAGLADLVVSGAELRASALREARSLGRVPPGAYAAVKRDVRAAWGLDDGALWDRSVAAFERLHSGAEAREGLAAAARKAARREGGGDVL